MPRDFGFLESARRAFSFLSERKFVEVESSPTMIRFKRGDIEVEVYHGRQSFEIGGGITAFGTRYSVPEIVGVSAPAVVNKFYYRVARRQDSIDACLDELSQFVKDYCQLALDGDTEFYVSLESARQRRSKTYSLEVLAASLRPKAEEAFRCGNFALAADLYCRIKECLSPAELKKLNIAEKRAKD